MPEVIILWENVPESLSVFTGFVTNEMFDLLNSANETYINSSSNPMPEELAALCYDENGEFIFPEKLGLTEVTAGDYIQGKFFTMGFFL